MDGRAAKREAHSIAADMIRQHLERPTDQDVPGWPRTEGPGSAPLAVPPPRPGAAPRTTAAPGRIKRWRLTAMSHGKLVRDRIPQIIRDRGAAPITRIADPTEYRGLLRKKLVEEIEEFLDSEEPAELADILEVLLALAADLGIDRDQLEALRETKAAERGGFSRRIVWLGNAPADGQE